MFLSSQEICEVNVFPSLEQNWRFSCFVFGTLCLPCVVFCLLGVFLLCWFLSNLPFSSVLPIWVHLLLLVLEKCASLFCHCLSSEWLLPHPNKFWILREELYVSPRLDNMAEAVWKIFLVWARVSQWRANTGCHFPDYLLSFGWYEASQKSSIIQNCFFSFQNILKSLCVLIIHVQAYLLRGIGWNPLKPKFSFRLWIKVSPSTNNHYSNNLEYSMYEFPKFNWRPL